MLSSSEGKPDSEKPGSAEIPKPAQTNEPEPPQSTPVMIIKMLTKKDIESTDSKK